ncbi:MAG TPA: hypothetical protein VMV10_13990 [Pirellulales bacterium]|nr:hypothetical protein [Pirellulales bacterium]
MAEQNQDNLELGGQAAFCASPTRVIQEADHIMDTVNEGARTKTAWA